MQLRYVFIPAVIVVLILAYVTSVPSQPSFNGSTPRCAGAGCHAFQGGILSVTPKPNLQVEVSLSGTAGNVAGELVDQTGTVVAVVNLSGVNPFTLTAPSPGQYTVNAGYKDPSRLWDSVRVTLSTTGVVDPENPASPTSYRLEQNYPNPFNPTTSIGYFLPRETEVTLEVYNLLGDRVATLVKAKEGIGYHEVLFDGSALPSGVYLYQIHAGGFVATRKLLLLK